MKFFQIEKPHAMHAIAAAGALPMVKAQIPAVPMDSRMLGAALAAEVMATLQTQQSPWHGFCWRLIDMPADGRLAFVQSIDKELAAMKTENEAVHGKSKELDKFLRGATTQISNLKNVVKAFNAGATIDGLREFCGLTDSAPDSERSMGWMKVVEYTRTFSQSTAGRPAQPIKVKLQNFIKSLAKGEDGLGETDLLNLRRAQEWVESLKD